MGKIDKIGQNLYVSIFLNWFWYQEDFKLGDIPLVSLTW